MKSSMSFTDARVLFVDWSVPAKSTAGPAHFSTLWTHPQATGGCHRYCWGGREEKERGAWMRDEEQPQEGTKNVCEEKPIFAMQVTKTSYAPTTPLSLTFTFTTITTSDREHVIPNHMTYAFLSHNMKASHDLRTWVPP